MSRIGQRNVRVVIEANTPAVDADYGSASPVWSEFHTTFAEVATASQSRQEVAGGVLPTGAVSVTIPFTAKAIRAGMRVRFRGRTLMVTGVINEGEINRVLVLSCTELAAAAG